MRRASLIALVSAAVAAASSTEARANGNQDHGESFTLHAPGGGVVFDGAGFSARPDGTVVTERTLEIVGIPVGSEVQRAFLYWAVIGGEDPNVLFDDEAVAGTLIGTSANTCWEGEPYTSEGNRVYRADVTDLVGGNGPYVVEGLPSSQAAVDAQGAELVVVYFDPDATDQNFRVYIHDGAFTQGLDAAEENTSRDFEITHDLEQPVPVGFTDSSFTILAGDGEPILFNGITIIENNGEGIPQFNGENLTVNTGPETRDHFNADLGDYWDDEGFEIGAIANGGDSEMSWGMLGCPPAAIGALTECGTVQVVDPGDSDCVLYAATLTTFTFTDSDLDSIEDGTEKTPVDNCPDDANTDQEDFDEDGEGDVCDEDDDDDGLSDEDEDTAGSDPLNPDTDDDGDEDGEDNCVLDENSDQADLDDDEIGDVCDDDLDGDGLDNDDEGPDGTGTDPENPDTDDDGILDGDDNCPLDPNEDQQDTDGDGLGDVCDEDDDDDGLDDDEEGPDGTGTDPLDPDSDDDGQLDGADPCPLDEDDDCDPTGGSGGGSGTSSSGTGDSTGVDAGSSGTGLPSGAGGSGDDMTGIVASGGVACSASAGSGTGSMPWLMTALAAMAGMVRRRRASR